MWKSNNADGGSIPLLVNVHTLRVFGRENKKTWIGPKTKRGVVLDVFVTLYSI
jgi:hypothetical protein